MINVIIVDDDKDLAHTTAEMLEMEGIKIDAIGYDGEEAYQLYEKHKPDAVILDMKMPNYDGGYALEKIKIHYPLSKIIVATGYTDYEFDKAKADAIFYKPLDHEKLLKKIEDLAAQKIKGKLI